MSLTASRRNEVISDIITSVYQSNGGFINIADIATKHDISQQSVSRILRKLVTDGRITSSKAGRRNQYFLTAVEVEETYKLKGLEEDIVFNSFVKPFIVDATEIVSKNFYYAFTEMLNNAIDQIGRAHV